MPLTTIKPRQLADHHRTSIESSKGFLGLASSLVTYDASLDTIFQNLLGTTAIFDTVDNAGAAARQVRYQVRIVTLDGTELRTGGSYAGGANRNNNTIFIKPELDTLLSDIKEKDVQLKEKEETVQILHNQLSQAKHVLDQIKEDGESARLAEQKASLAYEQIAKRVEELTNLKDMQEQELARLSGLDISGEQAKLQARLVEIEQAKLDVTQEIEQVKSNKDAVQERFDKLSNKLSDLKLSRTELTSLQRFEKNDLER